MSPPPRTATPPPPPRTYTLISRDFRNNVIVDPSTQNILYWIETEHAPLFDRVKWTYIYKPSKDWQGGAGSRELVATIDFRHGSRGIITYGGRRYKLKELFPKKSWLGKARTMASPLGKCQWSPKGNLYNPHGSPLVTYATNKRFWTRSTSPTLTFAPNATFLDMDLVVMGWMVMMHDAESSKAAEEATSPTSGASNGGGRVIGGVADVKA
ncbi:hypothetical protein DL93DRAFT_2166629 [Clavulina sp. PMI_390]|nr:hypothetical protein DL93DRAFT_2166629 [Clavulina sp. PMI_390]